MSRSTFRRGVLLLVTELAAAAYLLNVPLTWIALSVLVLLTAYMALADRRSKPGKSMLP